jgi:hypothetical protein
MKNEEEFVDLFIRFIESENKIRKLKIEELQRLPEECRKHSLLEFEIKNYPFSSLEPILFFKYLNEYFNGKIDQETERTKTYYKEEINKAIDFLTSI